MFNKSSSGSTTTTTVVSNTKADVVGRLSYSPGESFSIAEFSVDTNACALAYSGSDYAYVGCNTNPATVVKVNIRTMEVVGRLVLNGNGCRVSTLIALKDDILIHASYDNPWLVTKIDGKTMQIVTELVGIVESVNDKNGRQITTDGRYVYIGVDSAPGKVVKIDPVTMTRIGAYTFNSGSNNVFSLCYLNGFLYAGCQTSPAQVVKLNARLMQHVATATLSAGNSDAFGLTTDGRYLYIGCETVPVRCVKFDPDKMVEVGTTFVGDTGEDDVWSGIIYYDGFVYVGTWGDPTTIIKLNASTMARVDSFKLPLGYPSKLMYIAPFFVSVHDMSPGKLTRFLPF